jgi:RimJ/RimL family protein N-acetyltransferase
MAIAGRMGKKILRVLAPAATIVEGWAMNTVDVIRTDRLAGERLRPEHHSDFCRLYSDPLVTATLGGLRSNEEARSFLQNNLEHWKRHGFGLWMFHDPTTEGRFVGRAGLRHVQVGGNDEVELSYALMPEYWGRGLATEMARACVVVGFEQLGLADVVAFTLTTNRASQRVMQKIGFTYEREITHASLPHVLYRLCRAEQ